MAINLEGQLVQLRAVEPKDIDLMYEWENETENWGLSSTRAPFSRYLLEHFIESQNRDIFQTGQLRLVICVKEDNAPIGTLDLFDIDGYNHRAGVGILIAREWRERGYAADALTTVCSYAAKHLAMNQLWCGVEISNVTSLNLFKRAGY
ncbi:MAG: GNAT family N-acetyltransferase, partial [Rikenellaceae bacterium]